MRHNRLTNLLQIFGAVSALSLTILAIPTRAQVTSESQVGRGFGPVYDSAHETTLIGIIQELVAEHVPGSPGGMHLLVASQNGAVDAHVGPFLSQQTKEALQAGTQVLIVGVAVQQQDKGLFLARELNVGGHTVTIRNRRGCLVYPRVDQTVKTDATTKTEQDGGAR
jgi:hypothetical protein